MTVKEFWVRIDYCTCIYLWEPKLLEVNLCGVKLIVYVTTWGAAAVNV